MGAHDADEGDDSGVEGDDLPRNASLFRPVGYFRPCLLVVGNFYEVTISAIVAVPEKQSAAEW